MNLLPYHSYPSRRSPVLAHNMVSTSQPLAAQAGLSMLARGGNAVDAALAAAITLPLVEPTGNGLGSDAFCILWDGKELHGLNASGRAPAAWTPEYFKGHDTVPFHGWDSVTVPGAVSGWVALSERFGKLPFETLFEPAIGYAENGFAVSPIVARLWKRGEDMLAEQPGFAANFLPDGRAPAAGEIYSNRDFARSLRLIAQTRGKAFYEGELAEKIEAFAMAHGAAMRVSDLAAHKADWCGTISQSFDGVSLHEIPPNGQGIAGLMALGILDHTAIRDLDADDPRALHLQMEAMKLALKDTEAYVADIDYMNRVTPDAMLDPAYLAERAALIDPDRATDFKTGKPPGSGTVYLSAADASGMMVSFIQSNYAGFGSGVTVPGTGIHLQNRGAGFSLDPKSQNAVAPGKRPFHTIIPAFLMKGDAPLMSFGVMGGPMQAQGHVQMTLRTQLWGQDVQMAVDAPRWRVLGGLGLACETSFPEATLQSLADMGHVVGREAPDNAFGFGGAQLIAKLDSGAYAAGSDSRKDGQAVGF
ncbi:Gamma-glutamyltranspeptidase [Candidatus Rhodobacter oscarellae]|uniref:Gamma-glutamyltranspeptidase n=1 Tax=Candidatus Rhodobacter oscarellae TaxID=1675527 RepID=A0A0J9EC87_9RHOB|nr:gamma-glutamyltransferase family protein [Candidatus Rhodobacter lobularis]KMW60380.1 Gamma-glutamyltranspeptidase [Candidatus Rhodobacter lobularis]